MARAISSNGPSVAEDLADVVHCARVYLRVQGTKKAACLSESTSDVFALCYSHTSVEINECEEENEHELLDLFVPITFTIILLSFVEQCVPPLSNTLLVSAFSFFFFLSSGCLLVVLVTMQPTSRALAAKCNASTAPGVRPAPLPNCTRCNDSILLKLESGGKAQRRTTRSCPLN